MLQTPGCGRAIVLLRRDHLFEEIPAHTRYVCARLIYVGLWVHIPIAIQDLLGTSPRKEQPSAHQVEEQAPEAEDV